MSNYSVSGIVQVLWTSDTISFVLFCILYLLLSLIPDFFLWTHHILSFVILPCPLSLDSFGSSIPRFYIDLFTKNLWFFYLNSLHWIRKLKFLGSEHPRMCQILQTHLWVAIKWINRNDNLTSGVALDFYNIYSNWI